MSFTWASSMWRKGESKGKAEDGERKNNRMFYEKDTVQRFETWSWGEALV